MKKLILNIINIFFFFKNNLKYCIFSLNEDVLEKFYKVRLKVYECFFFITIIIFVVFILISSSLIIVYGNKFFFFVQNRNLLTAKKIPNNLILFKQNIVVINVDNFSKTDNLLVFKNEKIKKDEYLQKVVKSLSKSMHLEYPKDLKQLKNSQDEKNLFLHSRHQKKSYKQGDSIKNLIKNKTRNNVKLIPVTKKELK